MSRLLRSLLVALGVTAFLVVLATFLVLVGLWVHARFMAGSGNTPVARGGGISLLDFYLITTVIFLVSFGVAHLRSGRGRRPSSK